MKYASSGFWTTPRIMSQTEHTRSIRGHRQAQVRDCKKSRSLAPTVTRILQCSHRRVAVSIARRSRCPPGQAMLPRGGAAARRSQPEWSRPLRCRGFAFTVQAPQGPLRGGVLRHQRRSQTRARDWRGACCQHGVVLGGGLARHAQTNMGRHGMLGNRRRSSTP